MNKIHTGEVMVGMNERSSSQQALGESGKSSQPRLKPGISMPQLIKPHKSTGKSLQRGPSLSSPSHPPNKLRTPTASKGAVTPSKAKKVVPSSTKPTRGSNGSNDRRNSVGSQEDDVTKAVVSNI